MSSTKADVEDKKAVIFSVTKSLTFNQIKNLKKAIQHDPNVLISLGEGQDLVIVNECEKGGCSSSLGHTFQLPKDANLDSEQAKTFLAGAKMGENGKATFAVKEIETYKVVNDIKKLDQ